MHTALENKTTLVTGVSSGIGREIAQLLAERGARVFGTVRNPQSASPIPGVEIVRMEVTDDASVNEALQRIVQKAGPIQYLVNNAGYSFMGALEETSVDEARQQFETNLFGVLRVTNAILPGMRQAGFGRIVNVSSVLGFLPGPYMGIYAASKHAVEGYTETLDHEVRRFGVRALLVEPAYTKTKIRGNSKFPKAALEVYADERKRLTDAVQQNIEHGDDPRIVAEAVWNALAAKSPRLRYPVGKGVALSRMRRFVPAGMFDKSFRKQFKLDGLVHAPVREHQTVKAHKQSPTPQNASESPDAVVADEVGFVKTYRRPLMMIGLLAGGLAVGLAVGWCSKPAVKDPRLQSPTVEVFKAEAAGANSRIFTGIRGSPGAKRPGLPSWRKNPGTIRQYGTAGPEGSDPHAA